MLLIRLCGAWHQRKVRGWFKIAVGSPLVKAVKFLDQGWSLSTREAVNRSRLSGPEAFPKAIRSSIDQKRLLSEARAMPISLHTTRHSRPNPEHVPPSRLFSEKRADDHHHKDPNYQRSEMTWDPGLALPSSELEPSSLEVAGSLHGVTSVATKYSHCSADRWTGSLGVVPVRIGRSCRYCG